MTIALQFTDALGKAVSFSKTVSESDVYLFAGITGDFSPNHVDEVYMSKTPYGHRIAHGALLVGYMSRASTLVTDKCPALMATHFPVSLGYDRIRFLNGVPIGDTITVSYAITAVDAEKLRTSAKVEVHNQHGALCAAANHIMRWIAHG